MENLFSNRRYWMILALYSRVSHHKQKNTKIPFSNKQCWYYFPKVPITSSKKTRKSRFQKELKKNILALFSRQAQNTKELPFSNEVSHHKQKKNKQQKSCFQIEEALFSRSSITSQKNTGIPFSNRRGIIFQRFPSQAKKKQRKFRFQKKMALFSRGSHHKPKTKNTEIPFSNRIYWHYFAEVPITSPKSHRNSVFKKKILALFSKGSHHKPKKATEIPFSHVRSSHQKQKKHGNSVFK